MCCAAGRPRRRRPRCDGCPIAGAIAHVGLVRDVIVQRAGSQLVSLSVLSVGNVVMHVIIRKQEVSGKQEGFMVSMNLPLSCRAQALVRATIQIRPL